MGSYNTISSKNILLVLLALFLLIGTSYKFFEWRYFSDLAVLQSQTITEELRSVEKISVQTNLYDDLWEKLASEKTKDADRLTIYDSFDGKLNLSIDMDKAYAELLKKNMEKYKRYKFYSNFLVGKRRKISKQLTQNILDYYQYEMLSNQKNIVGSYLLKNIFTVSKDKLIMTLYDNKSSSSPETLYSKYFSEISSLEKYTNENFTLPYEEEIKSIYKYGAETIQNNKNYLKSYYLVIKDFVAGDYESANYKYSKLGDQYMKLNVDMDRLANENSDTDQERFKNTLNTIIQKNRIYKEFNDNGLGRYPLLPSIQFTKINLELCQIYLLKAGLFSTLTKKPIEATNFDDLLKEIESLSPSTSDLDSQFDKSIVTYEKIDKKINYSCTDKETKTSYKFIVSN